MRREAPDSGVTERELVAQLLLQYFRSLRLVSLRWLAVASVPVWLGVHTHVLPGVLAWFAVLAEGGCLAMAVGLSAFEYVWTKRVARLTPGSLRVVIHTIWTDWDELRSALWCAVGLISLVPWMYLAFERPVPGSLLSALTAMAWTTLLLLAVAETVARLPHSGGSKGPASAFGAQPPTWLGRRGPTG